jgi:hypothetical protein
MWYFLTHAWILRRPPYAASRLISQRFHCRREREPSGADSLAIKNFFDEASFIHRVRVLNNTVISQYITKTFDTTEIFGSKTGQN